MVWINERLKSYGVPKGDTLDLLTKCVFKALLPRGGVWMKLSLLTLMEEVSEQLPSRVELMGWSVIQGLKFAAAGLHTEGPWDDGAMLVSDLSRTSSLGLIPVHWHWGVFDKALVQRALSLEGYLQHSRMDEWVSSVVTLPCASPSR